MSIQGKEIDFVKNCGIEDYLAVCNFLYCEAELLDNRKFDDWYNMLSSDISYFMPIQTNRNSRDYSKSIGSREDVAIFDEDKARIGMRIKRLSTNMAWAEEPPSRTRHCISNIRVVPEENGFLTVKSNFIVYRNRGEKETDLFVGARTDKIRKSDNSFGWEIFDRYILLDQATISSMHISVFL